MFWFQQKPKVTKNFSELTETYNSKYGNFDYDQDSRSLDKIFKQTLIDSAGDLSRLKVLVCGSNSGYEVEILSKLFPTARFVALDIANKALYKLSQRLPDIKIYHSNMESLPFLDDEFDVYVNCRAIHSTDVDMEKALNEALRVTKLKLIITVSNGYRIDDKIVHGMYNYNLEKIDAEKPIQILNQIKHYLINHHVTFTEAKSEAELFLIANK